MEEEKLPLAAAAAVTDHHPPMLPASHHTEKTGNILLDVRRGQANPLLAALKSYHQAVADGNLLLVTYE